MPRDPAILFDPRYQELRLMTGWNLENDPVIQAARPCLAKIFGEARVTFLYSSLFADNSAEDIRGRCAGPG